MRPANAHIVWAEVLVDGLVAAGIRDAVVSPGSRSTPLALAIARSPGLRTTVVLDERVAAFVALGQARVTGRPSLLVCTSGSAGAHYLPAIVEASEANLPLLVLTADRPVALQERQAAQTMAQSNLFGLHARAFLELGTPCTEPSALRGLLDLAALAVARALDPRPGPVYLNARFAKPLEPQPETEADANLRRLATTLTERGVPAFIPPSRVADLRAIRALADWVGQAGRGVILAGPAPLDQVTLRGPVRALSERLGFPLLAEATSQLRFAAARPPAAIDFVDLLSPGSSLLPGGVPEVVIQLGRPVTSAGWTRWLEQGPQVRRAVLTGHGWNDPYGAATVILPGDPGASVAALLDALGPGSPVEPAWWSSWRHADAACRAAAFAVASESASGGWLTETDVARELLSATVGGLLMVANSLAAREVDLVPGDSAPGVGVLSQRGVNGIDGTVSGAVGAALAAGVPLAVLVGDLAFQHDLGGLAVAAQVTNPLPVVVLDNQGGRLFEQLPLATAGVGAATLRDLFQTPQRLDLAAAARAFGVASVAVTRQVELQSALASAFSHPGATVVVARISGPGPRERRTDLMSRACAVLEAG